jgi:hypothetical protein
MQLHENSNLPNRRDIWREVAEELFNDLTWQSDTHATIECPGSRSHSKAGNASLFLDHVPTINCFHQSCKLAVEDANKEFRSECQRRCREAGLENEWTASEKAAWVERRREEESRKSAQDRLRRQLKDRLPQIVDDNYRTLTEWVNLSPSHAPLERATKHLGAWLAAMQTLDPDQRLWIGNKFDSGSKWHKRNFATVGEWIERLCKIGSLQWTYQHVVPANFARWKNLCNRVAAAVEYRKLLAVEFDSLAVDATDNKELGLAVVRYICDKYNLRLFSACDSGNKSVHALITWPQDRESYDAVIFELESLGADPGPLHHFAASCRLPGAMRADDEGLPVAWQRLYFLDVAAGQDCSSSLITHPDHRADTRNINRDLATEAQWI